MKTKLQELLNNNRGLVTRLYEHDKISEPAITRAAKGVRVNFNTKFRIYTSLLELGVIDIRTKTLDLFEPIETCQNKK